MMRAVLGSTTADINLTAEDYQGNCLQPGDGWGTYTYEVLVLEYEGGTPVWTQGEALDWQFLKRYRDGYHLWVPKNLPAPYGEEPGHDVWTEVPEEGEAQLRGYYVLAGDWGAAEAQVPRGNDAQIVIVDPELAERAQTTGPGGVSTLGSAYGTVDADEDEALDGLALYTYQEEDPAGTWRGIFTASDNGGLRSPAWRTHEPVRMITANARATRDSFDVWHNSADSWAFDGAYLNDDWVRRWFLHTHGIPYRYIDIGDTDIEIDVVGGNVFAHLSDEQKGKCDEHTTVFSFVDEATTQLGIMQGDSYAGTQQHGGSPASPDVAFIQKNRWDEWCEGKTPAECSAFFTHIYFHELGHALSLSDEGSAAEPPQGDDSDCIMRWRPVFPRWSQSWGNEDPWHPHVEQHRRTAISHLGGRP